MSECPHPEKYAHKTRRAAEKALANLTAAKGVDLALRPYRCVCGAWHLGHKSGPHTLDQKLKRLGSGRAMTRRAR